MFMTISLWIKDEDLEKFKKFYDAINNEQQIEKKDIPKINLLKSAPIDNTQYIQINVLHEIYIIMIELL